MSAIDKPVDIEASDLNTTLNSNNVTIFLMVTKNSSKHYPAPVVITLLYFSNTAQTAIQWYSTKWVFIDNGNTRQSAFSAMFDNPQWTIITDVILIGIIFVLADGLLIWRCYHVWNHSWHVIWVSLLFVITEIALFLVQVSFRMRFTDFTISIALAVRLNRLLAAAYFISFATTFIMTILIAYRIYSVSNQKGASSRRFKQIIDIVVQSGMIYALAQLAMAIASVAPGSNTLNPGSVASVYYAQALSPVITGISSTIMVTWVALLSEDAAYPSTSFHISGLQFNVRSTNPTVNIEAIGVTNSVDGDRVSSGEGQAIEEKT